MDAFARNELSKAAWETDPDNFVGVTMVCSYYTGPGADEDYCRSRARVTFDRESRALAKFFRHPRIVLGKIEEVFQEAPSKNGQRLGRLFFRCAVEITEGE